MNNRLLSFLIICLVIFLLSFIAYTGDSNVKKEDKKIIKIKSFDVLKAKIGSAPNEIGAITPSEANPEGPMSFTLSKDGNIYILDQINQRIQIFKNGKWIKSIPIPKDNFPKNWADSEYMCKKHLMKSGNLSE